MVLQLRLSMLMLLTPARLAVPCFDLYCSHQTRLNLPIGVLARVEIAHRPMYFDSTAWNGCSSCCVAAAAMMMLTLMLFHSAADTDMS